MFDDQPNEYAEKQQAFLEANHAKVVVRSLDLAQQNSDADGLIDAVLEDMALNPIRLQTHIHEVSISGVTASIGIHVNIMTVFMEFFKEQAENELLEAAGLL